MTPFLGQILRSKQIHSLKSFDSGGEIFGLGTDFLYLKHVEQELYILFNTILELSL